MSAHGPIFSERIEDGIKDSEVKFSSFSLLNI